jgi:hypothetical protein
VKHRQVWAARERRELKSGGSYYLMLMDLRRPLRQGETIKAMPTFEKAGTVPVEFEIEGIGARSSGHPRSWRHSGVGRSQTALGRDSFKRPSNNRLWRGQGRGLRRRFGRGDHTCAAS